MHRHSFRTHFLAAVCFCAALPRFVFAADSGSDLAAKLRAKENGSSLVRIKMDGGGQTLQIQIKSRVSGSTGEIVYQILFPKERKGEAVLLHRSGSKFSATSFKPPGTLKELGSDMKQALFGTDLSLEDIIDSPFAWSQQAIVGTQNIDRFACQILESKPGGHASSYASVKTWIDPQRMVPLQIEKYDSSGKVIRRINITRVLLDGGDSLPADLEVTGPGGSVTRIHGSGLKRGQNFPESDFTANGLKQPSTPPE